MAAALFRGAVSFSAYLVLSSIRSERGWAIRRACILKIPTFNCPARARLLANNHHREPLLDRRASSRDGTSVAGRGGSLPIEGGIEMRRMDAISAHRGR